MTHWPSTVTHETNHRQPAKQRRTCTSHSHKHSHRSEPLPALHCSLAASLFTIADLCLDHEYCSHDKRLPTFDSSGPCVESPRCCSAHQPPKGPIFPVVALELMSDTNNNMASPQTATRTATPPSGSRTIEVRPQPVLRLSAPSGVLRLRAEPAERRHIQWAEDVVDNEGMGKKSSKGTALPTMALYYTFC
jgi:hypothetical protein